MDNYLLQLQKEFGQYSSWALWDEHGEIKTIIESKEFDALIKPNVIFMGLNGSSDILHKCDNWMNFHFLKEKNNSSWKKEHCRKLAEVLSEPEFSYFNGAYMTDIIKTKYDPSSGSLMQAIKKDPNIISENKILLEQEMKLLSKYSKSDKFQIICIGDDSYKIFGRMLKHESSKIWHYSAYQLGWEGVKERIRQDLRKIMDHCLG
jgi:hypothetical protein